MDASPNLVKKYEVMVNDVDFTKKLKLSAIFNFFQEVAGLHAYNLGVGYEPLQLNYRVAFVLTKMKVVIDSYPEWKDEIIIETWPRKPGKLEFERDFIIKDLSGKIHARAISNWVLLDTEKREMKRPDLISIKPVDYMPQKALEGSPGKVRPLKDANEVYNRKIGCSDIDMNEHLNNTKYLDFIMDCFSLEELRKYEAKSIQMNYLNEAFPGDIITLYKSSGTNDEKIIIEGIRQRDESPIFRAALEIREREQG